MPFPVIAIMLLAASLSAGWNAAIKGAGNKLYMTILMTGGAGLVGALVLPFLARPGSASWPFIAASAICSIGYYAVVARAYHIADLSQTYPIMRGTAPLLVALTSQLVLGERLPFAASYSTTLWAMTVVPVAMVAALRETSILFALVISALVLKERVGARRLAMVCAIACGAMVLRLA